MNRYFIMTNHNPKLLYCPKLDIFASLEYTPAAADGWTITCRLYNKAKDVEYISTSLPEIYSPSKDKILALRKLYLEDLYSAGFQIPKTLAL